MLDAAVRELPDGVAAGCWHWQSAAPARAAGHDPRAEGGRGRGGGSPVCADLVDVEVVGIGGQVVGDLLEEIAGRHAHRGHGDNRCGDVSF